jgi:hypothetical protein
MDSKQRQSQKIRVYESLKEAPKTRLQVALELDILRGNVCYFIRDFRNVERVAVYKKGKDPITGHKSEFLTTDTALFPEDNQTRLFD